MELKFEETKIPEDVSKEMVDNQIILGAIHLPKVIKVLGAATSKFLGKIKNLDVPMSLKFVREDGSFIAGMQVEYHKNPDDPENPSAGNWSYIWTFDEADLEGSQAATFADAFFRFTECAAKLYGMRFESQSTAAQMFNIVLEHISHWLEDNARENEEATLIADGVFTAKSEVRDGKVVKAIIPDGDLKVLIKGDDMYQED